ncbi:MAG: alpha/beta fold hydrolase [Steroidobacteraceae bacterium]
MRARDDYFLSGAARLRFRDEGEGMPVVFIHGWTVDLDVWNPQAAALWRSMRFIRFDRRGFGLSEGTPALTADCDDLRVLLDRLAIPRASLVGTSQGARVALAFALRLPERVTSLVLDGPPDEAGDPVTARDEDFSVDEFRRLVQDGGVDAFRRVWRDHPLMKLHSADAEAQALLESMLARYPARDLLVPDSNRSPPVGTIALARFRAPVLVVNGQFDTRIRLEAGERLGRSLPRAERIVIPDAGHLPNLDDPAAYNEAIQLFLRRQSRAAA